MAETITKTGTFVISLDFELFWGMTDKTTLEVYGENIRGVRRAIPALLSRFEAHGIRATWATVGMLTPPTKSALIDSLPEVKPEYKDKRLSNYEYMKTADIGEDEASDPHHFGASLLRKIQETKGQEIGSHTFSHYYCAEDGQTVKEFEADLDAEAAVLAPFGVSPVSIVFPRNQWREDYLPPLRRRGYIAFRGNERGFVHIPRKDKEQTLVIRALRLLDHYLPLFGSHTYTDADMRSIEPPHNVPASFFLRPYTPVLKVFDGIRLARIKAAMTTAAKEGKTVHLWWHPHNFGKHLTENLALLDALLSHYDDLKKRYGMKSLSMRDVAEMLAQA
jgi:peptidoglycan/xylan/chitin deacetylase (PgdA/CDA1 family)